METTTTAPPKHFYLPQDDALSWLKGLKALVALVFVVGTLAASYQTTLTPVTLVVDDQAQRLHTHQGAVTALLMDTGIALGPEDIITPALDTPLEPGLIVEVQRARPVYISADGHSHLLRTHATSVEMVLEEARVSLGPHDEVKIEGELVAANRSAERISAELDQVPRQSPASVVPEPVRITVHRAIPFTLHEGGRATTLYTTAPTVGETLRRAGLTLYLADGVRPGLGERMSAGLHVYVDCSIPVTVQVDGRTLRTRTHRQRVDEVLADLGLILTGQDYAIPAPDAPLEEDATIRIVRVSERFLIEQDPIPFETVWQADPDLEIDYQRALQEGAPGILERRIRIRYEDGHEVARVLDGEYLAVPPTTKIFGYGSKIIVRTLDTPSGPIEYWRVIRMLATSYSASTAGTPKTSPWYGHTATGMKMRHGIVAVDPRVVALRSQVYVPGYGVGIAGDTGGAVKGQRIDLGYDDDNLVLWYRWVDVYLLTPAPPSHRINYLLGP